MTARVLPLTLALSLTVAGTSAQQATPQEPPRPSSPQPAAGPPQTGARQQPPVTFRAEVNYVEVDARVFDEQGQFVSGLSEADFQLFEDGKPQKVSVFSLVSLPVERPERPLFAARPIEPDVHTNVRGYDGRVYLIVLDDLHTHPLRSSRVKAAARRFVESFLGANDVAAVVHTSGRRDAGQEFTNNSRLLLGAIDKFMGRKVRSSTLERIDEEQRTRETRGTGDRIDDPSDMERSYQARSTLDTVKGLAEYLGGVQGRRKALVLFSEGIDYDITDPFANRDATTVMTSTRDTIAAATRANVAIYGIDARGLTAGGDEAIEIGSFPTDTSLGLGPGALQNEIRLGQDSLRVLAEETGGFAAVNSNDLSTAFERLVEENSTYYVLGYYPTNERRDGRFRRIEVRTSRPGLTVRARRGYAAPRGRAQQPTLSGPNGGSTELRRAVSSPLPLSGLPLAAVAAVFKGPAPNGTAVVSILVGARDLPLTEKEGTFRNELEVALVAMDQAGKTIAGDRNTVSLNLKPDTVPRVRAAGFRVISQLDLPPGRYQLRAAVTEANTQRAGSVFYDLEVPDYTKEALALSSIALTSPSSTVAPTARQKDALADLLPGPLTSYREFSQNDEVAFFVEAYERPGTAAHKVALTATVKAEGGQTVFESREERESSELGGKAGGYGFSGRVPLKGLSPGLYVLRVEARSLSTDRAEAYREVVLRVVERTTSQGDRR